MAPRTSLLRLGLVGTMYQHFVNSGQLAAGGWAFGVADWLAGRVYFGLTLFYFPPNAEAVEFG